MKILHMQLEGAVTGLILIIVGLIFIPGSWNSMIHAKPLFYGEGYIPFFSSVGLCICGLSLLWEAFQSKKIKGPQGMQWRSFFRGAGLSILSMIAYTGVMEFLGFGFTTFLFMVSLLRILKAYSWPIILVVSAITAVTFYYVFKMVLNMPLPLGRLFSYLFFS